jgi:sensitive to high expression protein 9
MRPLLQHASRAISAPAISYGVSIARQSAVRSFASRVPSPPSICVRCEYRASVAPTWGQLRPRVSDLLRRRFHKTPNDEQEPNDEKKPMGKKEAPAGPTIPDSNEPIPIQPPNVAPKNEEVVDSSLAEVATPPPQPKVVDNIARVPAEHLPSHREAQRWGSSKRLNKLMDDLLPKLADMTQKVNTYTGTDYTGIEALKREIKEQGTTHRTGGLRQHG